MTMTMRWWRMTRSNPLKQSHEDDDDVVAAAAADDDDAAAVAVYHSGAY